MVADKRISKHRISISIAAVCVASLLTTPIAALADDDYKALVEIHKALSRSQYNEALEKCEQRLKTQPNNVHLRRYAAIAQYHRGFVDEASTHLGKCLKSGNDLPVDHLYMGDCKFSSGDYKEAVNSYRKSILMNPANKPAFEALIKTYETAGDGLHADEVRQSAQKWGHSIPKNGAPKRQVAAAGHFGS